MEEIILKADLGDSTSLYISPVDETTYREVVQDDNLGGAGGYFVMRARRSGFPRLEILAKATSLEAAQWIFDLAVGNIRIGSAANIPSSPG